MYVYVCVFICGVSSFHIYAGSRNQAKAGRPARQEPLPTEPTCQPCRRALKVNPQTVHLPFLQGAEFPPSILRQPLSTVL